MGPDVLAGSDPTLVAYPNPDCPAHGWIEPPEPDPCNGAPDLMAALTDSFDEGRSVECAWPPCKNRLRRVGPPSMSGADHPQWCSKGHRAMSETEGDFDR